MEEDIRKNEIAPAAAGQKAEQAGQPAQAGQAAGQGAGQSAGQFGPARADGRQGRGFRGGRGGRFGSRERREPKEKEFFEKTVKIRRCSKTVKGGRRQSFSAVVVSGDQKGKAGFGFGKANDVSEAVRKATEKSREKMVAVPLKNGTIPHEIIGRYKSATVVMRPAAPGTGVIAGSAVRAACEAAGITDILCKSLGSKNAANTVKATFNGLENLLTARAVAKARGKSIKEIWG